MVINCVGAKIIAAEDREYQGLFFAIAPIQTDSHLQ